MSAQLRSLAAALSLVGMLLATSPARAEEAEKQPAPRIQMAILLDTSGSMSGLINQARTRIWKIVNELATAKRDGRAPDLEVAVYHYGNAGLTAESGYVKQLVPLTTDLDKVSEELFALTTNGGEEYCGRVVAAAVEELKWSESDRDLKLVFVAGNEPFTQGDLDPKVALQKAIENGIVVNTIFCGNEAEGVKTSWNLAEKYDGSYTHVDQNQQVAEVKTPFDEELAKLGAEINRTYVVYGAAKERKNALRRQLAADEKAAAAAPGVAVDRAAFKGRQQYRVTGDLVEALERKTVELEELDEDELPEELKKLDPAGRKKFVEEKAAEREALQKRINQLAEKRKQYVAEERKRSAEAGEKNTLDAAVIGSIREQARRKQFDFGRDE